MKLAVCSIAIGEEYKKAVKLCTDSLKIYCAKHNYPLITSGSNLLKDRELMWNKVPLMRRILHKYDYIVWIDADIMIMNTDFKLEKLIELYLGNRDMLLSIDSGNQINTGFWVVKNSEFSHDLLSLIENCPEIDGNFQEQGVLNFIYNKKKLENVQQRVRVLSEVEQRLFNANIYNYREGDFLIHFLGVRVLDKLEKLSNDHYPYRRTGESDFSVTQRAEWRKEKYSPEARNQRYIIPSPKVKIEVCQFYNGPKYTEDTVKYGQLSMKKYCAKYRYNHIVKHEQTYKDIQPHWNKFALLSEILKNSNTDYVVWFDADVMVHNHDISIEDVILEHMHGKDFLLSRDVSNEINTGVIIVRNTPYAVKLLDTMLNFPELKSKGNHDQDTFNIFYERNIMDFTAHCSILDKDKQHIMNCCIGLFKYGYWLVHFYSTSKQALEKAFSDIYPFKKEGENDQMFEHRLGWIKHMWK